MKNVLRLDLDNSTSIVKSAENKKTLKTLNKKLWGAGEPTNFLLEVFVGPLSFTVFL